MNLMKKIEVTASKSYPIFLGVSLLDLGQFLKTYWQEKGQIIVISQPEILIHYQEKILSSLKNYKVDVFSVPSGEEEKSLLRIDKLTTQAVNCEIDRKSLVIALGGGVIGDLGGFFASIYMRGIPLIQIPTTLLAQVDSSIGGKVAVNHPLGKNLIGAFYPPLFVWTDFSTLQTLPWEEFQNGLAETIKHALVNDYPLFEFLESHWESITSRQEDIIKELVTRSAEVKVNIVSQDEKEQGARALLNLGHSFGHALETDAEYVNLSHGQGVSLGIVAAGYVSLEKGYLTSIELFRIIDLLNRFNLPTEIKDKDPERLLALMASDKKNQEGHKILILPKGIGQAIIDRTVTDDAILKAWQKIID